MIPKKFKVFGTEYTIDLVESSEIDLNGDLGEYCDILHEIKLAKTVKVDDKIYKISDNDILKTYLHELGHCFEYNWRGDTTEEFAQMFSNFMYEYLTTKK